MQLDHARGDIPLVSVGLQPFSYGDATIVLPYKPGKLTMTRQILAGLQQLALMGISVVYFTENDVLYHPEHFTFTPKRRDVYYYNEHTYKVDWDSGQSVFYYTKQTSGLCTFTDLLLGHYKRRVERIMAEGKYDRRIGFEPGCHQFPRGIDQYHASRWMSTIPNVDIRHDKNLTLTRWSTDGFRDKNACQGWTLADRIPGWGHTKDRMPEFIANIPYG